MTGWVVREAAERDAPAVEELCRRLDRCDYMLRAWRLWVRSPGDLNLVAEAAGRVVGCIHAGLLSPTETFLQGLRVAPEVRRRGLASQLLAALVERLGQRGLAVHRAVTAPGNAAARGLLAAAGWRLVHAVARRRHRGASLAGAAGADGFGGTAAQVEALDAVTAIVGRQEMVVSRPGLAYFRRLYCGASAPWLTDAVSAGEVVVDGEAALFLDPPAGGALWLHAVAGPPQAVLDLLARSLRRGPASGSLTLEAPDGAELQSGLDRLGFAAASARCRYLVLEAPRGAVPPPVLPQREAR